MAPINESELEWIDYDEGDAAFRRKQLGGAADGEALGCSLYELPPGSRAWPYHYHTGNEEAMYVLSGTGRLRLDGESYPLEAGDYVAFPADESGGHRVINDGGGGEDENDDGGGGSDDGEDGGRDGSDGDGNANDGPLRYLMLSTMNEPDVTIYPDSNKLGVYAGSPPGGRDERSVHGYYDRDETADYWDGDE